MECTVDSRDSVNPEAATLNQLIAEFKSSLASRNINLRGKLTFTLEGSAQVDVQFQPPQQSHGHSTVLCSESSDKNYQRDTYVQSETFHEQLLLPHTRNIDQAASTMQGSTRNVDTRKPTDSFFENQRFTQASFVSRNIMPLSTYPDLFSQTTISSSRLPTDEHFHGFQDDYSTLGSRVNSVMSKSTSQDPFPSMNLSHKIFSVSETSNIERSTHIQSTTTLPPFANIIQQKYQTASHHRMASHGFHQAQVVHNYNCSSDVSETDYESELLYRSVGLCHSNKQFSLKDDYGPNDTPVLVSSSFKSDDFCLGKELAKHVVSVDNNHCNKSEVSPHNDISQPSEKDYITKDIARGASMKSNHSQIPLVTERKNTLVKEKNHSDQEPQVKSTLESKGQDSCKRNTLRSIKECSIDVRELENLSHKELVAILTQVLTTKDLTDKSSVNVDSSVSVDSSSRELPQEHVQGDMGFLEEDVSFDTEENTQMSSLNTDDSDKASVSKRSSVVESISTKTHITPPRKSLRKRKKPSKMVGYEDDSAGTEKKDKDASNIRHDEADVQRNKDEFLSYTGKQKGTKMAQKSSPAAQPLKKRNRLRASLNEDSLSKNEGELCEEDQQENLKESSGDNESIKVTKSNETKRKRKVHSYACKQCDKVFSSKLQYRRHVRSHSAGFQCDVCGKTLKTKDSLYHHQRGLHTKDKPYCCKLCNATFSFHHSFKLHMQRHKGERPHRCSICHKTYLTSNHLKVHTEAAHGVGSVVCHICGKTFSYNCTLKQHLLKHSGVRPYSCSICEKSFVTKQSLEAHKASHNDTRNYPCDICGKLYKSEHSRNVHVTRHVKQVRKFMCELCGKSFFFKSTLKAHISTHSKARPHTCPQCGKAFKSKASLYTHSYVHRETQGYACNVCGKTFKTKTCCSAHMKRHNNETSFTCHQCGSAFPDKGGLTKHIKTIHVPKKQFTCTICGKKGTRGDNMRTHVKSHKGEKTALDPMQFITEETILETDLAQGIVEIQSRLRGPRQKTSRRLCTKEVAVGNKQGNEVVSIATISEVAVHPGKSEAEPASAMHPTLMNLPGNKPKQYNSQAVYFTSQTDNPNSLHNSLTNSSQDHQQHHLEHHQRHPGQTYQQESNKLPYYITYMPQQSNISSMGSNSALAFGPMTSLLSAINPTSEHDSLIGNSVYHSALPSLHSTQPVESGSQRIGSSLYADSLSTHGGLSQLHQILTRPADSLHTDPHKVVLQGQNELHF